MMKKPFVILMLAITCCAACLRQDDIKELDTAALSNEYGKPTMQLSVGRGLLWLASLVGHGDREFSDLVSHVKSVHIVTYRLNGNPAPALDAVLDVTRKLKAQDWEPIVTVSGEDEQTRILVKLSEDTIHGMVIMSVQPGDEAVFINISGEITPDMMGKISSDMNMDVNI